MNGENAIEVKDLKKIFKIYPDKSQSIKEKILFFRRNKYDTHWVLRGVDFSIKKGEAVGLIGRNGCGKSTTLKLLNRIMYPTDGNVYVNGRVSSLIELGAGFHPDMSGRENIYINASIFGLTKKQIDDKLDAIIEFSELEEAIDNPVRTYSSGMYMRLAFSVAINVEADILLIDEILAVGDVNFQKKCFQRLREIKCQGTTIVIVSHSLGQIEQICDRCIWIHDGKIREEGEPKRIHAHYLKSMEEEAQQRIKNAGENAEDTVYDSNTFCGHSVMRSGSGRAFFTMVSLYNKDNVQTSVFESSEYLRMEYKFQAEKTIQKANFAMRIYKDDSTHCFGSSIMVEKQDLEEISGKSTFIIEIEDLGLLSGNYMVDVDIIGENGELFDNIHDSTRFFVQNETGQTGICRMDTKWQLK